MAGQENPKRDVDGARLYLIACCIMSVTLLLSFVAYVLWFGTVRITYFDFVPLPGGHVSNGTMSILFLMLALMFPALLAKSVCADGTPQIQGLGARVFGCGIVTAGIYFMVIAWPIAWMILTLKITSRDAAHFLDSAINVPHTLMMIGLLAWSFGISPIINGYCLWRILCRQENGDSNPAQD